MLALDSISFFCSKMKNLISPQPLQEFKITESKDCISYFGLWLSFVQSTALGPQNSFKIPNHINSGAWRRPNKTIFPWLNYMVGERGMYKRDEQTIRGGESFQRGKN